MLDDYKLKSPTKKLEIEIESDIVEKLLLMEQFAKLTCSEIANTALKRFISQHKDFLPANPNGSATGKNSK